MNFQKTSKRPLTPPPALVSENYVALFSGGPKICNEIHSDWRDPPPFSENSSFLPPQNFLFFCKVVEQVNLVLGNLCLSNLASAALVKAISIVHHG